MLLGKRPRPPLKRTTSMNDIMFDVNGEESAPSDPHNNNNNNPLNSGQKPVTGVSGLDQRILATVSPRNGRRYSANFIETASFLRACGLCKRRLVPGRDIYMYRGDTAFCSLECRQQQINHDERKEKCSLVLKKEATASSTKSESVAAL